jgi:hypothetical protein
VKSIENPISRKGEVVSQVVDNDVLIYDLKRNKAFCLNETSALIWQLCDGEKSVSQISEAVSNQLKSPFSDELVWLALDQLKKENLLENGEIIEAKFANLSRREVVRKIGFASMVALPVIASIVAPTAANAQSNCVAAGGMVGPTTFPNLGNSLTCLNNLIALCCSMTAASGSCTCTSPTGPCTGSFTCG